MEAILERCCGLDVHKREVVACLLVGATHERPRRDVRRFATLTVSLRELRDWLVSAGCTHVAMESTGPYCQPVFNLLEGAVTVVLANARHIKNVPGRKTDVRDCEWIAQLLRCGLIRGSFIPPAAIRELRDLTPLPAPARGGGHAGSQSGPEAPRARERQAGLRAERRLRGLGAGHAGGAQRRPGAPGALLYP